MAEYIEREAAIKEFSNNGSIFVYGKQHCKAIVSRLNSIPAADVRPVVRGKWIDEHPDKPNDPRMRCSVCTCVEAPLVKWRFCPNCGAMMEKS